MSQPSAQKVMQGKRAFIVQITIPIQNSEAAIVDLLPARISEKNKKNITGIRIYGKVAAGTDRAAFNFGDIPAEMFGFSDAGANFYIAASESSKLLVESTDGSTVDAIVEVLIG